MSGSICPICGSQAGAGHSSDYGERQKYDCPRCGQYEITATAVAMLQNRADLQPLHTARASHAVRSMAMTDPCPSIDSTNVHGLVDQPLPAIQRQLQNLLDWSKAEARDAHFATISLPALDTLASVVGALDVPSVVQLFNWGESQELLVANASERKLRLTPAAWGDTVERPEKVAELMAEKDESIESGHCPKCGGDRDSDVVGNHYERTDDGLVWVSYEYFILKCRGCRSTFVKRTRLFSEDEEYDTDPVTGEFISTIEPTIEYWPSPVRRKRPPWFHKLKDKQLKDLMDETYGAVNGAQHILAAIGTRTALDRAMVLLGADEGDSFYQKLEVLRERNFFSEPEHRTLSILTDAGSASVHRSWQPSAEQVSTMLDGIEAFFQRHLIVADELRRMNPEVPRRPRRGQKVE